MPNWMSDLRQIMIQFTESTKTKSTFWRSKPFQLLTADGTPFTVFALSNGEGLISPYFIFKSLDDTGSCIELEVLCPYRSRDGMQLFRTEACIMIDLTCFCGFQLVDLPVFDYLCEKVVISDRICFDFQATKANNAKIIYINKQKKELSATITVRFEGTDSELQLMLDTKEEEIPFIIKKSSTLSITVSNLRQIIIVQPYELVKGEIDIQLNFFNHKITYF